MTKPGALLLAVVVAACGTTSTGTPNAAATVLWDTAAATAASAAVERGVQGFAAMDADRFNATFAQDGFIASFDVDLEGKPVAMADRAAAIKYAEDTFAEAKKMNATLQAHTKRLDCRASATVAFCSMELDFNATMPDGKTMTQPTLASIALIKEADGWKWAHWHASLSSVPAPAANAK